MGLHDSLLSSYAVGVAVILFVGWIWVAGGVVLLWIWCVGCFLCFVFLVALCCVVAVDMFRMSLVVCVVVCWVWVWRVVLLCVGFS